MDKNFQLQSQPGVLEKLAKLDYQNQSQNYELDENCQVQYSLNQNFTNWSSTHKAQPQKVYVPRSPQECQNVLQFFNEKKQKIRVVGRALSPNGIGLSYDQNDCMISLHLINNVIVDVENLTVTVGAGALVKDVLIELKKSGLTLENFSAIQEQQIGGWMQVSAHGTGSKLPTVDEMIVRMKIATPNKGLLELNSDSEGLFEMAKVGLGSLGVVIELTLKCVPLYRLKEEVSVFNRETIIEQHFDKLNENRHLRYLWIPYTQCVVSYESNITDDQNSKVLIENENSKDEFRKLLLLKDPNHSHELLQSYNFALYRDILLDQNPLDLDHVKNVNLAEAAYWQQNQGLKIDDSINILGYDCGGEQLVYEVCFPIGKAEQKSLKDIEFVKKILELLEQNQIPAHSPIEQRWSARSTAPMSPAYSKDPHEIFSWVNIIMYLPPNQNQKQRCEIQKEFYKYSNLIEPLVQQYKGKIHWAKIEIPFNQEDYETKTKIIQKRIQESFNVEEFNKVRQSLDPKHILSNKMIDILFQS